MPDPQINRLHLGVVLDLLRRAFGKDAAVVHHGHKGRNPQRDVEIVLDDDVTDIGGQRVQNGDEIAALRRRQARRRLVEKDKPRRARERERDLKLPLLTMAQN